MSQIVPVGGRNFTVNLAMMIPVLVWPGVANWWGGEQYRWLPTRRMGYNSPEFHYAGGAVTQDRDFGSSVATLGSGPGLQPPVTLIDGDGMQSTVQYRIKPAAEALPHSRLMTPPPAVNVTFNSTRGQLLAPIWGQHNREQSGTHSSGKRRR